MKNINNWTKSSEDACIWVKLEEIQLHLKSAQRRREILLNNIPLLETKLKNGWTQ